MASHREFVEFVSEQLREAGGIRASPCLGSTACTAAGFSLR